MVVAAWIGEHWKDISENVGIIGGLFFTGIALFIDIRARRAQTNIEITKMHRELWTRYEDRPELVGLFDGARDLTVQPLTSDELRFANSLFLHIHAAYRAEKARIYDLPARLGEDLREVFSYPAIAASWGEMKHLHDPDFVAFIEDFLK